ncbi:MAG: YdcH family protein [Methyloceanibacter sp.]|uniref:YdcH family protein n=1 Tax=Methyloceanibacter sp. TaxID=1965321 RepID=UPI003D9B7F49
MESEDIRELRTTLTRRKQEHRDLDSAINALEESGRADALQLKRLKKKKLFLKDEISRIEDQLLPDIIA